MYELFLKYESRKAAMNAFDVCDLVRHVFHGIRKMGGYRGAAVHSTFVDEVQDFTEAEIKLLMNCSAMPNGFCTPAPAPPAPPRLSPRCSAGAALRSSFRDRCGRTESMLLAAAQGASA